MTGDRRCPTCGALVAKDAEWCGQCYSALGTAQDPAGSGPPAGAATSAGAIETAPWDETASAIPADERPSAAGGARGSADTGLGAPAGEREVVTAEGGAFWPCPVCNHGNPIRLDSCAVCGTPFARLFREQEPGPQIDPGAALLWSALFPGLGHWRCRRALDGVARAVIFAWTFGTLVIIVLSRIGKGGLGATAALFGLFLVSALAVWGSSAYDAYRIAGGYEPLVSSRTLLWGSVVLIVVSVLLATLVTLPAVRGA